MAEIAADVSGGWTWGYKWNKTRFHTHISQFDQIWSHPNHTFDHTYQQLHLLQTDWPISSTEFFTLHFQNEVVGISPCFDGYRFSHIFIVTHNSWQKRYRKTYRPPTPPTPSFWLLELLAIVIRYDKNCTVTYSYPFLANFGFNPVVWYSGGREYNLLLACINTR